MQILHQVGNSTLALKEVDIPQPKAGEVLIKTRISAICGSELSTYRQAGRPEGNLGHEAAGTVAAVATGSTGRLQVGQRVGVSAIAGCGDCEECRAGRYTWCNAFTFHCDMHAEYFAIPERACHLLPDDLSWEEGVLISGDGFGVPYHTSTKTDGREVRTVAVVGLGPIGLGNVLMQSFLGRTVIGIDRAAHRLEFARSLGAGHVVEAGAQAEMVEKIKAFTDGAGACVAIEAAGVPATAKMCFALVKKGGLVMFNGEQPAVELSPSDDFIRRDITATGSWFYHFHEFSEMLKLVRKGLRVTSLITHRYPLAQASEGYRLMQAGETGKVVLLYPE